MTLKTKLTVAAAVFLGGVAAIQAQTCKGPQPTICERSCWNARSPSCSISTMSTLNRAVIHHTANQNHYGTTSLADSKANMRGVQNFHMDSNGWCDIGYHFLVDKLGNIFEGRSGSMGSRPRGGHDGCNENSFGFTAMGYFHSPYNDVPTTALMNALEKVIAWRMPAGWSATTGAPSLPAYCGNSTLDSVITHRQVKATACPGDKLEDLTKNGSGFENAINARRVCP